MIVQPCEFTVYIGELHGMLIQKKKPFKNSIQFIIVTYSDKADIELLKMGGENLRKHM